MNYNHAEHLQAVLEAWRAQQEVGWCAAGMDEAHQWSHKSQEGLRIPINPNCCLWLTRIFLTTMLNCIDSLLLNATFRYDKHDQAPKICSGNEDPATWCTANHCNWYTKTI
jgi:hypothetical protein